MQDLKYYVLGKKDSPLLKEYLEKFYEKLIKDIFVLQEYFLSNNDSSFSELLGKLLDNKNNKDFILNAEFSSIINYLTFELIEQNYQGLGDYEVFKEKLEKEIIIFLDEGIDSDKLNINKGNKIAGTNIKLTLEDNVPYNKVEAHPEHHIHGGLLGWGEKTEENWLDVYEKTFKLLRNLSSDIYDELNQIITKIIPLGTARGLHNSASYKEAVGHLYMGYTIDSYMPEINNLEAIIHESSHNKLNLLAQFDPIVLNGKEEKYYSAIRPDARPLYGVFLGVHAFAPTIYMLSEGLKKGIIKSDMWLEKCVLYMMKTKFLYKVIDKHAELSELGQEIFKEIKYVIGLIDKNISIIKPSPEIIEKAKKNQIFHFSQVNRDYPHLEY